MSTGAESGLNDDVAKILRYGTALSAVVIAAGLLLTLLMPPGGTPATLQSLLSSKFGTPILSPSAILANVVRGDSLGVLELGLLILLATPITRVGASVVLFLREKDMLYAGTTLLVFVMLLFALFVVGPMEA